MVAMPAVKFLKTKYHSELLAIITYSDGTHRSAVFFCVLCLYEFFSSYAGIWEFFSVYAGLFSRLFILLHDLVLVNRTILVSSYVGTHKSGNPQASVDISANRLVLLDRVENGSNANSEIPEDEIPF